jgi:GT2 family glycosyltransferase
VSIVIPTYRREAVLVETIEQLVRLPEPADEILVVDQTEHHQAETSAALERLQTCGAIRWLSQTTPSITAAMNRGLVEARGDVVLFVDDDVVPGEHLLRAHRSGHAESPNVVVAGRVFQPWQSQSDAGLESFAGSEPGWVSEFMGGNFSVRRDDAITIGGFDENFVQVAYRFEAEFAVRFRARGGRIRFEPAASLEHLHVKRGGTRSYGEHLTTSKPAHAVGAYYFVLRTLRGRAAVRACVARLLRSVSTRHHLRSPWWVPVTLLSELRGLMWALELSNQGPRLMTAKRYGC